VEGQSPVRGARTVGTWSGWGLGGRGVCGGGNGRAAGGGVGVAFCGRRLMLKDSRNGMLNGFTGVAKVRKPGRCGGFGQGWRACRGAAGGETTCGELVGNLIEEKKKVQSRPSMTSSVQKQ